MKEPEGKEQVTEQSPRLWREDGWIARVIKNEDDDGWAVEMTREGDSDPALVGPWTMGRDKKNPKPLDRSAFLTLVKTASEVLARHAHAHRAMLHKSATATDGEGAPVRVELDIIPDPDDPRATLSAWNVSGEKIAQVSVRPDYKLNSASAERWVRGNYAQPS